MTNMVREELENTLDEVMAGLSRTRLLSDNKSRKARKYSRMFFAVALAQVAIMITGMTKGDWINVMIINLPFIFISVMIGMALRSYSKEQDIHSAACIEMCSALRIVREYIRMAFG